MQIVWIDRFVLEMTRSHDGGWAIEINIFEYQ
jgi:hypothetical protein